MAEGKDQAKIDATISDKRVGEKRRFETTIRWDIILKTIEWKLFFSSFYKYDLRRRISQSISQSVYQYLSLEYAGKISFEHDAHLIRLS